MNNASLYGGGVRAGWVWAALPALLLSCSSITIDENPPPLAGDPEIIDCAACTVFTAGGTLFDGHEIRHATVVVEGDHVSRVITGAVSIKAGTVVDTTGKTLLPGLWDLAIHASGSAGPQGYHAPRLLHEEHFKAMLRAGVTSALDLGSRARSIFAYRARIDAGKLLAPRLFAAGPLLTPTGGDPCPRGTPASDLCVFIDGAADAATLPGGLFTRAPDVVTIVVDEGPPDHPLPRLSNEAIAAVQATAQGAAIPVIAQVTSAADVSDALDQGVRLFARVPSRDLLDDALLDRLVEAHAVIIPAIARLARLHELAAQAPGVGDPALADDVPAEVLAALTDPAALGEMSSPAFQAFSADERDRALLNLQACVKRGVTIAAGTEAGSPGTFHGLALRQELGAYVAAGLAPIDALRAASSGAAAALAVHDRGVIAEGAHADLLLVEGRPDQDLAALGSLAQVYVEGRLVDRAALALSAQQSLTLIPTSGLGDGEVCLQQGECADGLYCDLWLHASCTAICDPDQPDACPQGAACVQPEAADVLGYCLQGEGCDPLAQDCSNHTACAWIGHGATFCAGAGDAGPGEACGPKQLCAPGSDCDFLSGTCLQDCDPAAPESCSEPGKSCVDFSEIAGLPVGQCQ